MNLLSMFFICLKRDWTSDRGACLDVFFPSCSATVLYASPSAHDQSAAALRRPPARHLAALHLFLEALLFAQSAPNRWISRVGKNIGEKSTPWETGRVAKQGAIHRGNFAAYFRLQDLLRGELNAVCVSLRFFPK